MDAKYSRLRFYEALLSVLIKSLEPLVAPEGGFQGLQPSVMRVWSCPWGGRRWEFILDTASRDKDDGKGEFSYQGCEVNTLCPRYGPSD